MSGSSNEYMNTYMKERWRKRRMAAIEKLGGKCVICGIENDLQFDHIDPYYKTLALSDMPSASEENFWHEVSKCQLLCKECHKKKTLKDLGMKDAKNSHGTISSYRYCKCELCKKAKSDHSRAARTKKMQQLDP